MSTTTKKTTPAKSATKSTPAKNASGKAKSSNTKPVAKNTSPAKKTNTTSRPTASRNSKGVAVVINEDKIVTEVKPVNEIKSPRILTADEYKKRNPRTNKSKKKEVAVTRYRVDAKTGLKESQVAKRVEEKLTNKVENKNTKTYLNIFLGNIFTFFNLLCFVVGGALIAVKAYSNLIFLIVIVINMLIGIIQEIRAKKTIERISLVTAPSATVIREGRKIEISIDDVVLDDIILFSLGKQICADCVVLDGEVEVNESLLTGESVSVKKKPKDILLSGSFVVSGKCTALVDKVGNDSYTAQLAEKAKKYNKPKSDLLKSLRTIILGIGIIILPLSILMFYNNYYVTTNSTIVSAVKTTAASIVGMIPAGMFLLTSMALAVGVIKLARRRTLVQDLYSIEMLARTDVLCLDKTGTITDGTMKVNTVIHLGQKTSKTIGDIVGSMLTALGDNNQTSRALATHFGYSKELTKVSAIPFNSAKKFSAVTFKNGETYAYGAPEFIFKGKNTNVENLVKQYASKGFRVLLLVKCDGKIEGDKLPVKREPIALIVIEDHIRDDAAETIKWFKENGVQIKIISGDNAITVSEVSKRVGIEGAELFVSLEGMNELQVVQAAEKYTVFGRVSPEQKCILVKALKSKGLKVAMTGDGVNDILALKEADCSIAMASGSEATRHVSHLVLLDSNFSSMPSVVAEGRRVVNNIQKSSSLFLMKTFFTMLVSVFCIATSTLYPFTINNMLLLEFLIIGVPSFFLALQPNSNKIRGKLLPNIIAKAVPGGFIMAVNVLACYLFDRFVGTTGQWETMAALVVTFTGFIVLLNISKPLDVFRAVLSAVVGVLIVLSLTFIPFSFFELSALTLQNILFMIILILISYPTYSTVVRVTDKLNTPRQNNK